VRNPHLLADPTHSLFFFFSSIQCKSECEREISHKKSPFVRKDSVNESLNLFLAVRHAGKTCETKKMSHLPCQLQNSIFISKRRTQMKTNENEGRERGI